MPSPRPVVLLVLWALVLAPAGAEARTGEADQLARARQRVAEVARELRAAEVRAADAEAALADADRQLATVEAAVNEAAAAVERQQVAVQQAAVRLGEVAQETASLQERLARRAAQLYRRGSAASFEMILASGRVEDVLERGRLLRAVAAADSATLEALESSAIRLAAQRERFTAERERLEAMQREQEELLVEVEELRRTRALRAAEARAEVRGLRQQQDDLEEDAERLERLIRARRATPASSALPSTRGYVWPVCAVVTSEFGRRWGRLHAGIDIGGGYGTPIGAAKAGTVIFAGWHGGYGRLTLIDHGDGVVTAYAHQASQLVGSGQHVERGERIGTVGSTGNSTGPHLHLETRVNGSPVDPRRFLPRGC